MIEIRETGFSQITLVAMTLLLIPAAGMAGTLIWSASSGQVDGYKVHWSITENSLFNDRDVGNTTQYDLVKLPLSEGTTYFLSVSAYNSVGESPPCEPVVFTPGDNTPPAPPAGLASE